MKKETTQTKQQAIQMSADKRDIIMANWNHMKKDASFEFGDPAHCLKYAIEWYKRNCVTKDYIIVPIHVISFIKEDVDSRRAEIPEPYKELKCLDLKDLEDILKLWGTLPQFSFITSYGPNMGKGINLKTWATYEYVAFSIWLYCYECNGFGPYYVYDYKKFGKNMHLGFNYVRWQEVAFDRNTFEALHVFGCTRYYIGEGRGEGDTPSTLSRFKELFMEQGQEYGLEINDSQDIQTEQQMDDHDDQEFDGPEIGGM